MKANTIKEPDLIDHIDRVGIELYSRWKDVRLNDVCQSIISGGTPLTSIKEYYDNGTIAWIKTKEVLNNKIYDSEYKISELGLKNSSAKLLPINSVIIAMYGDGDTAGRIAINKIPLATNQACGNLIINSEIADFQFVFYYLLDSYDELVYLKSGSGQQNLNLKTLKDFTIKLPPLKEQTSIATILSSLDDKIDLLHRQNKTLEQLAETLFRSYFPMTNEENNYVELGNYVECINGVSYKSSELNPSKVGMVSLKSFDRNGGFSIEGFKEFTGKYKEKQVVVEGDLIVAHTDITQDADVIGNPALVISNPNFDTMIISMDIVKVISKADWISIEFVYFLMRTREFKSHCKGCANGSTVLHLNKQAIPTFELPEPNKNKVVDFTKQAKELLNKIFLNHRQLRNLVKTRDTLLPKLMSGEVRVII